MEPIEFAADTEFSEDDVVELKRLARTSRHWFFKLFTSDPPILCIRMQDDGIAMIRTGYVYGPLCANGEQFFAKKVDSRWTLVSWCMWRS